jgi:hypothetical protein
MAVGCWLAAGYWLLAVSCWLMAIGYWLLAIGYWLLAGCWLLAAGYWLLAAYMSMGGLPYFLKHTLWIVEPWCRFF